MHNPVQDNPLSLTPWYKQFWPWVLIILPLCAVVASLTTLYIAANNKPELVAEDYYKKGKAINQDLSKIKAAFALALKFELAADGDRMLLTQTYGEPQKAALRVNFIHRTLSKNDFSQLITADSQGVYALDLEAPLSGKWTVQIESFDGSWRVQQVATFPTHGALVLDALAR